MVVRRAVFTDIRRLYEISLAAHSKGYLQYIDPSKKDVFLRDYQDTALNYDKYQHRLRTYIERKAVIVAEREHTPVGFLFYRMEVPGDTVELRGFYVHPDYQGLGIGSELLAAFIEEVGVDITLTVLEQNIAAQKVYAKFGFKPQDFIDRRYYGARLMRMDRKHKSID